MNIKDYLSDLELIVNIDSGKDCPEGQKAIADFFEKRFWELGWKTKRYAESPEAGDTLVCMNRKAERYDVMLIGHIDTVFPRGTAADRPFFADKTKAFGAGVFDMKQGALLMYYLMKELPDRISNGLNILAVFNHDEEIGSPWSKNVTSEYAKICDAIFVYEGAGLDGARCITRKGRLSFKVEFLGRDGHCGYVFENDARSAISEMARWIVALDGMQSKKTGTTVNIGVVSGGVAENVVAKHACLASDIRFSDPEEYDRARVLLNELTNGASSRGISVSFSKEMYTPALVPSDKTIAFTDALREKLSARGRALLLRPRGGLSDANKLAPYCSVCIDGMGPAGDNDHSSDEYLQISSVREAFEISLDAFDIILENKKIR